MSNSGSNSGSNAASAAWVDPALQWLAYRYMDVDGSGYHTLSNQRTPEGRARLYDMRVNILSHGNKRMGRVTEELRYAHRSNHESKQSIVARVVAALKWGLRAGLDRAVSMDDPQTPSAFLRRYRSTGGGVCASKPDPRAGRDALNAWKKSVPVVLVSHIQRHAHQVRRVGLFLDNMVELGIQAAGGVEAFEGAAGISPSILNAASRWFTRFYTRMHDEARQAGRCSASSEADFHAYIVRLARSTRTTYAHILRCAFHRRMSSLSDSSARECMQRLVESNRLL